MHHGCVARANDGGEGRGGWWPTSPSSRSAGRPTTPASWPPTLTDLPRAARRAWSSQVVQTLEDILGGLSGVVIELHAGSAYLDNGLAAGLSDRGAVLEHPVKGLSFGQQLAFYRQTRH
jgi:hypothetical protein